MERYEELRTLACSAVGHRSRDWEELVANGLAAWMKAWSALTTPSVRPPAAVAGKALFPACPEIVTLLADLAMSTAEEVLA
jgi:hypothetical protein